MRCTFDICKLYRLIAAGLSIQIAAWAAEPEAPPTVTLASTPAGNAIIITQALRREQDARRRNDIPGLVAAINDEADARLRLRQFDTAEKLRLDVLHLEEQHAGRDSLEVSDALLNLGWYYANMARYEAAQQALDRCQDIRQRKLGPDAPSVAEVLNALGSLEENRGNLSLSEAFYEQAIAIQEKVFGPQSATTANTYNNLATLDWIMGDYAAAQKLFAQALAVREKALGPNSAVVAKTLNNLALLDCSLGDYDEAEDYFQRALKIRTARLGRDNPITLTTLSQLGLLYVREGDDARAEPLLVQSVAALEKLGQGDDPDFARSLEELAMLYDRRKDYTQAGPLHARALDIRKRVLGTGHPEYAASLAALARHDHAQGNLADALPLYQQALAIDEDALGPNHPDTLAVATDLAFLQIELRQPADATRLAENVAEAQQNMLNGVFTFAAEHQRMGFERTLEPCDLPAALADADLLAKMVLKTKGVVLDSLLEDAALTRAEADPDLRDLLDQRRLLLAQLGQSPDAAATDPAAAPMTPADRQKLEQQLQQIESALAEKGIGSGRTRRALETDVSEIRDALPAGTALVEYVACNRYTGRLTFEPAYGAIVLTADACRWVPLGAAAGIDAQVRLAQKYMRKRVHETVLSNVLRGLDRTLVEPVVAALPDGVHRLVLSPDGSLNFVSFATLLDANNRFLADDYEIDYVASGRDLLQHGRPGAAPRPWFTVFAYPDYDAQPAAPRRRARAAATGDDLFPPLPGTRHEADLILAEAKAQHLGCEEFTGAYATKAQLAQVHSPYVLHLATHGLYLSPDDLPNLPPAATGAKNPLAQPMARSLLAFTGASATLADWKRGVFPPPETDGLLTAQEAANLDLDRTWLVTLSACDTGSGEAETGEGVLGLRRGFAEAGAQNLLVTLWTADDLETADFMAAFYRDALKTGDAPGALARTQRAALDLLREKSGLTDAVRKAGPFVLSY